MSHSTAPGPADWDDRYRSGDIPWDMGRPHPLLTERLVLDPALGQAEVGGALVPGCGQGWDAMALAEAGWVVTALDVSPRAVALAGWLLDDRGGRALVVDALEWEEPVDLIFDHTFFCAIPPEERGRFGDLCRRVLGPGGQLVSIVFPIGRTDSDTPPYAMSVEDVSGALGHGFELIEMGTERKVGRRAWPHRLCRWRSLEPAG